MSADLNVPEPGTPFGWMVSESLDAAGIDTDLAEPEPMQ